MDAPADLRSSLVLREEVGQVEARWRVDQVDVLATNVLLDPVVRQANMFVARGDGVDTGPLLGGDVVADEERRVRYDRRDAALPTCALGPKLRRGGYPGGCQLSVSAPWSSDERWTRGR